MASWQYFSSSSFLYAGHPLSICCPPTKNMSLKKFVAFVTHAESSWFNTAPEHTIWSYILSLATRWNRCNTIYLYATKKSTSIPERDNVTRLPRMGLNERSDELRNVEYILNAFRCHFHVTPQVQKVSVTVLTEWLPLSRVFCHQNNSLHMLVLSTSESNDH
jgi:hypothetical protein